MPEISTNLQTRRLRVSSYDQAWSWLLALLLLIGSAAFILFMVWLSNRLHQTDITREVTFEEVGDGEGGGDGRPAGGTQLESPADSSEPVPIVDTTATEMNEMLAAVSETVVEQVTQLDDPSIQPARVKGDYGTGGGSGGGSGPGRGMGRGPGKPGRPQRWEVRFNKGNTVETYAKQLDFFKIELGVLTPNNSVTYISNFSGGKPTVRSGKRDAEKRYRFSWRGGDLKQADLELFKRAGVGTESGEIYMFIPLETYQDLMQKEKAFKGKPISEINKTIFNIISDGGGFKFNVIEQRLK